MSGCICSLLYIWVSVWELMPGIFGLLRAGKLAYGSWGSQDGPSNWFSTGNSDASHSTIAYISGARQLVLITHTKSSSFNQHIIHTSSNEGFCRFRPAWHRGSVTFDITLDKRHKWKEKGKRATSLWGWRPFVSFQLFK